MKAYYHTTDGRETEVMPANGTDFTLAELQELVGGYVEIHGLPDGQIMCMNEDANSLGLPVNAAATVTAYNLASGPGGIRGNVVICPPSFVK